MKLGIYIVSGIIGSTILLFFLLSSSTGTQNASDIKGKIRSVAEGVLKDATFQFVDTSTNKRYMAAEEINYGSVLRPESPYNDWRYWNGVLNIAMIKLGEELQIPEYSEFAAKNIYFCFNNSPYFEAKYKNEDKWSYPFGQFIVMQELDDCGAMGSSVIEIYRTHKEERYRQYIDKAAIHIMANQSRLADGTLVRSFPQKWTLWADDLYMGLSFLSRMGELTNEMKYFDDAAAQVINFHKYLFDDKKGLMHHCWYSESNRQGAAFWGRANGWALVAQVDLLDRLPINHPQRDLLLVLLKKHISGVERYQDESGLWHQLLDKPDSFLETSCTAMFTYAIARAVDKGYIEPHKAQTVKNAWNGVMTRILPNGKIEGICAGTAVSDDLNYYYQRPTPLNDIHGVATVLLAGAEMLEFSKEKTCKKCH